MTSAADECVAASHRRVKLYILNEDRVWEDSGTGHVAYDSGDDCKTRSLIVRSERDGTATDTSIYLI